MFETIRAYGALRMGLIANIDEAAKRQHTPKVAFVAKPADYVSSSGKRLRRVMSTCWCVRCRWASCTTR
jgi:2-methylaconitate cis-trans-isomerase PrpF